MGKLSSNKLYDADENAARLHAQFIYVKIYCTIDKIKQWKDANVSIANRWTEMFKHFESNECEYKEVA